MNIIRKIIREEIERILLSEGRFDQFTGAIVDVIWMFIKKSKEMEDEEVTFSTDAKEPLMFSIEVNIKRVVDKRGIYEVSGSVIEDEKDKTKDKMIINIKMRAPNRNMERYLYSDINEELNEVVRHEIEHIVQQKGANYIPGRAKPISQKRRAEIEDTYSYFVSRDELPAMIAGFYRKAKTMKVPIDVVASGFLDYFVKEKKIITRKEKEKIMKIWMKYARENYPSAKFSSKFETF